MPVELYEAGKGSWKHLSILPRFRQSAWFHDGTLCVFGGFEHNAPTQPIGKQMKLDLSELINSKPLSSGPDVSIEESVKKLDQEKAKEKLKDEKAKGKEVKESKKEPSKDPPPKEPAAKEEKKEERSSPKNKVPTYEEVKYRPKPANNGARLFKMSPRASVAMSYGPEMPSALQRMVKTLAINNLQEEAKKLVSTNRVVFGPTMDEGSDCDSKKESIAQMFVNHLLRPKDWSVNQIDRQFIFKKEDIIQLAQECKAIVEKQPIVLRVKAPVKVFGDFHGQYQDMMRFFDLWRGPTEASQGGDIESYDYLFLGDYVDRGAHSLETICLLMALKVKYPGQIHLLRGNHEDGSINRVFGFAEECEERLDDEIDDQYSVFRSINNLFEWLPLAGVIDDRILCLHGGIGSTLNTLADIERIRRPVTVVHEVENIQQQLLIDILWSDPTDNDQEYGIQSDLARDPNETGFIVRYGPDRVEEFLRKNELIMIVRGHECVMDGIERFAKGQLITLFSATDYCGKHKNAGAALFVQKNFEIVPKLIFPLDTSKQSSWIDNDKRPQTPPGWKEGSHDESFD